MVNGISVADENIVKVIAAIDGEKPNLVINPLANTISINPKSNLKPGRHTAVVALVFPNSSERKGVNLFFTVDPTPPKITVVLGDAPSNTLYVFFHERLNPGQAANPLNWGFDPGTMNIIDSIGLINGGLTAVVKMKPDAPNIYKQPGPLDIIYNSERGQSRYRVIPGRKGEREGQTNCICDVEYEELALYPIFKECENNAICFKYNFTPPLCPVEFHWSLTNRIQDVNDDACNVNGECAVASFEAGEDTQCVITLADIHGAFLVWPDTYPHTIEFARELQQTFHSELRLDCDNDGIFEAVECPVTYTFGTPDCENPEVDVLATGDGVTVANALLSAIQSEEEAGNRVVYESFLGSEEAFYQYLQDLAAENPCNRFALLKATDIHTLHPDQALYKDSYSNPMLIPCCLSGMNVTLGIMVDIAPLADYTLNGQFHHGEEKMYWPDPVYPYFNCYGTDNQTFRELEYAVIRINEFVHSEFMKARYVDSLDNWRRTPRLWDAYMIHAYAVSWNLPYPQQQPLRQYVNWEKNPGSDCEPANYGTRRCIDIQVSPPPMFENYLYLLLSYIDPPLDPQGRAFPWDPGDPYPRPGDNRGTGEGFPDPTPGDIVIAVPCTGRVHTYFNTTEFGGDNFIILGFLYIGIPGQPGSTFVGQYLESAKIEVWRFYSLVVNEMDPDYLPLFGSLPVAFNEAYVQFGAPQQVVVSPYRDELEVMYEAVVGWNIMDYSDDVEPEGDYNDEFKFGSLYHDPVCDYLSIKDTVHIQGIDKFKALGTLGCTTNYVYHAPRESHKQCFIAVGRIRDTLDNPDFWIRRTTVHEMGHCIRGLSHTGWVMETTLGAYPNNTHLDFMPDDLKLVRQGPCLGDNY